MHNLCYKIMLCLKMLKSFLSNLPIQLFLWVNLPHLIKCSFQTSSTWLASSSASQSILGVMYVSELSQLFYQGPGGGRNNCAMCAAAVSADRAHPAVSEASFVRGYPLKLEHICCGSWVYGIYSTLGGGFSMERWMSVCACWELIPPDGTQKHVSQQTGEEKIDCLPLHL